MLIHVSRDGQQFGPYTPEDVQTFLADGSLLTTDMGWVEGAADWVPLPQLVASAAAPPPAVPGVVCPRCGVGLEADQVICLSCGHNLDEPLEEVLPEEGPPQEKRKIPPSLTYEDELADRSAYVNSVAWALLAATFMPVFGDGEWNVPVWKFWALDKWQMMFEILAPAVAGLLMLYLASQIHGRARGVIVLVLGLLILGAGFVDDEIGGFKVFTPVEDLSEPIPEPLSEPPDTSEIKIPEKKVELEEKNVFYERLGLDFSEHAMTFPIFLVAWMGVILGAKARFYRIESMTAYIISLIGGLAAVLVWFIPDANGMPVVAAIDMMGNDLIGGIGILVMMAMMVGAGLLCFINTLGKRPSQMKRFSSLAATLMMVSIAVPVIPIWGKVALDEFKDDSERAVKRQKYVESQFGEMFSSYQTAARDKALDKLEKPINAKIGVVCGWLMTGVKYVAWTGGLLVLIPLGLTEILCGTRERDDDFMILQQ